MKIKSEINNIYCCFNMTNKHLKFGKFKFILENKILGNFEDTDYASLVLSGIENMMNVSVLLDEYKKLSDEELFDLFEQILNSDEEETYSSYVNQQVYSYCMCNWGTFLDDFSVYAYQIENNKIKVMWKKICDDKMQSNNELTKVILCKDDIEYILNDFNEKLDL